MHELPHVEAAFAVEEDQEVEFERVRPSLGDEGSQLRPMLGVVRQDVLQDQPDRELEAAPIRDRKREDLVDGFQREASKVGGGSSSLLGEFLFDLSEVLRSRGDHCQTAPLRLAMLEQMHKTRFRSASPASVL